MTVSDIIQLVFSAISLVITISISIFLFKLEQRQSKRFLQERTEQKLEELDHNAENFIIQNSQEIEYLPLCVFANKLNNTHGHKRNIYNNFNMCSEELQAKILEKQNIKITKLPDQDWLSACTDRLIADIEKHQLGKNLFFDDAKYVQQCFFHFSKENTPNLDRSIFRYQDYYINNETMTPLSICQSHLHLYISKFLTFSHDKNINNNPSNIEFRPPCDYVYKLSAKKDNKIYCYWNALLMRYLSSALRKHNETTRFVNITYSPVIDTKIEYFEDLYYSALYELYLTYGNNLPTTQGEQL